MPSKSKAPICKHCQKPGFKAADGTMQHERRSDPTQYGGRRADPKGGKRDEEERPPDREHPLGRKLFGKRED